MEPLPSRCAVFAFLRFAMPVTARRVAGLARSGAYWCVRVFECPSCLRLEDTTSQLACLPICEPALALQVLINRFVLLAALGDPARGTVGCRLL